MPIYMDIHEVPGAEALDLAEAHRKDILIQDDFRCKCITYWLDESRGSAFCLIEAPDISQVGAMHKHSHGLVPNKVIEVKNDVVAAFLGRIHDPEEAEISDKGLKVFSDSAYRILLVTEPTDPVLLRHQMGTEKADALFEKQHDVIREALDVHEGREVETGGAGFIASFTSAKKAVDCALEIQKNLSKSDITLTGLKLSIHSGEPVSKSDKLFGDVIQLARCLCAVNPVHKIAISSVAKDLLTADYLHKYRTHLTTRSSQDESFLEALSSLLEKKISESEFSVTEFCQALSMSKSQLYRKIMSLWGLSPNQLLKEFRLNRAKELLNRKNNNISEVTFDAGFTSPSYFTKCFKSKFGLLPAAYLHSV